jgi:hypothetical protein
MDDERGDALESPRREGDRAGDHEARDDDRGAPLRDGKYDAFILTAERRAEGVAISCAITAGPQRGDVIDLVSTQFATRDPFDLVGMPCTLVVTADTIRIEA